MIAALLVLFPSAVAADEADERDKLISDQDQLISDQELLISDQRQLISDQELLISDQRQLISNQDQIISNQDQIISNQKQIISNQRLRLNEYRCLLGIDLHSVGRDCPWPSPPFEPRNWEYFDDMGDGRHRYTAHGSFRPHHPAGKSLANLEVSCTAAPEFAPQVEVQLWETLARIGPDGTAEVSYRVGDQPKTGMWRASRGWNGSHTMLNPPDAEAFLADVLAQAPAPLRLSMADEDGGTFGVEFAIDNIMWVIARLPYHCEW